MGTVVAIAAERGVAIAADTSAVEGGTVTSRRLGRVFDFGSTGAGVVGDPSDIQAFERQLDAELKRWQLEREKQVEIDAVARIAARLTDEAPVDAAVGARDSTGTASLREVGTDGHVFENGRIALGSGAETALGHLETADPGPAPDDVEATARETVELVMERDVDTGDDIDSWSLGNASEAPTGDA